MQQRLGTHDLRLIFLIIHHCPQVTSPLYRSRCSHFQPSLAAQYPPRRSVLFTCSSSMHTATVVAQMPTDSHIGSIIIVAKCPLAGKSKTRLIPLVGESGAVKLASAMLSDVLTGISKCVSGMAMDFRYDKLETNRVYPLLHALCCIPEYLVRTICMQFAVLLLLLLLLKVKSVVISCMLLPPRYLVCFLRLTCIFAGGTQ
jgi:hypothetical protein